MTTDHGSRATPDSRCYVTFRIPRKCSHQALEPCQIGRIPHCQLKDSEARAYVLLGWLEALSPRFSAKYQRNQKTGFGHQLTIFYPIDTTEFGLQACPVFDLFFTDNLTNFKITMPNTALVGWLVNDVGHCEMATPEKGYAYILHFFLTDHKRSDDHPYKVFSKVFGKKFMPNVSETIRNSLCRAVVEKVNAAVNDENARNNLGDVLSKLTSGSVRINYTNDNIPKLQNCGDKGTLFSLTCVFPWAIDILLKHPNCLMTDSTFKVLAPYTLPILHAIFANESIPIAFGVSPSETALSYHQIYQHIADIADSFTAGSPLPPLGLFSEDMVAGTHEWPEEDANNQEEELTGEQIPPVWEGEVLDSTIPAPPPVNLDNHMGSKGKQQWTEGQALLRYYPILTDQGAALQCFIKKWKLDWKICHRHIIEAIGANGLLGSWATRLLGCYSEKEWRRTCEVIIGELTEQEGNYPENDSGFTSVKCLLGIGDNAGHCLANIDHWALWRRLGCPRTTNSAESVNGHLNQSIDLTLELPDRIFAVARHFRQRYGSRNTWCDRALVRNAYNCFPSPKMQTLPWFSPERVEFYQKLHNATGLSGPVRRKFPPPNLAVHFPANFMEHWLQSYKLPPKFVEPRQGRSGAEEPRSLPLHRDACENRRAHTAWQIAASIRKHLGFKIWQKSSTQIFHNIITIGIRLNIPEDDEHLSPKCEAVWRSECWKQAHSLVRETLPTEPPVSLIDDDHEQRTGEIRTAIRHQCQKPTARPKPPPRPPRPQRRSRLPKQVTHDGVPVPVPVPGIAALINPHLRCFFNAALQCLVHLPPLSSYFDRIFASLCRQSFRKIAWNYNHIQNMMRNPEVLFAVDPSALIMALDPKEERFPVKRQHDAIELLSLLLESLHEDLLGFHYRDFPPKATIISQLFGCWLQEPVTCGDCGSVKTAREQLSSISLPIPNNTQGNIELRHCLAEYCGDHEWDETCLPVCSVCGKKSPATRTKGDILDTSELLVFQLRRFRTENTDDGRVISSKFRPLVLFPLILDMTDFVSEPSSDKHYQYRLVAVIRHKGRSMETGHYIAYVSRNREWFCCDDATVVPVDEAVVLHGKAYGLFYQRVDQ